MNFKTQSTEYKNVISITPICKFRMVREDLEYHLEEQMYNIITYIEDGIVCQDEIDFYKNIEIDD